MKMMTVFAPTVTEVVKVVIEVVEEHHIPLARQKARAIALVAGLSHAAASLVATSVSELALNLVLHATRGGSITTAIYQFDCGQPDSRCCLEVTAEDYGPGIPDVELAMEDDYSTGSGLGCGLPSVRRMMDEFDIASAVGRGTRVSARMWKPGRREGRRISFSGPSGRRARR